MLHHKKLNPMKKHLVALFIFCLAGIGSMQAQFSNIYTFDTTAYPYADVTVSGNKLFGVAYEGGPSGYGFIFTVDRSGHNYKVLWNCADTGAMLHNSNGAYPYGNLTLIGHRLYGFAYEGGAYGYGLLFSLDTNGSGYKDLYDFNDTNGAYLGWGNLTLMGNKFYGMTVLGGPQNAGVIFSVDTDGVGYRRLFYFNDTDGSEPEDMKFATGNGKFYGMTYIGGANDSGVIFSVDTSGKNYKVLKSLGHASGYYAEGHLILLGGKLYGLTQYGGAHDSGVMFSIDTNGSNYTDMKDFNTASGSLPYGSLTYARGKLFAMNYIGGTYDEGNIFEVDTTGSAYTDIHDFNDTNGYEPYGNNLVLSGDTLFGMTWGGGKGYGNIFYYIDTNITTSVPHIANANVQCTVYPNPSNGQFNFVMASAARPSQSTLEIYNALGEKVYSEVVPANNSQFSINLLNQPAGIYLYRIMDNTGAQVATGKLAIQ